MQVKSPKIPTTKVNTIFLHYLINQLNPIVAWVRGYPFGYIILHTAHKSRKGGKGKATRVGCKGPWLAPGGPILALAARKLNSLLCRGLISFCLSSETAFTNQECLLISGCG